VFGEAVGELGFDGAFYASYVGFVHCEYQDDAAAFFVGFQALDLIVWLLYGASYLECRVLLLQELTLLDHVDVTRGCFSCKWRFFWGWFGDVGRLRRLRRWKGYVRLKGLKGCVELGNRVKSAVGWTVYAVG